MDPRVAMAGQRVSGSVKEVTFPHPSKAAARLNILEQNALRGASALSTSSRSIWQLHTAPERNLRFAGISLSDVCLFLAVSGPRGLGCASPSTDMVAFRQEWTSRL